MSADQRYTSEFKREAVKLTQSNNAPINPVAQELGIHYKTLSSWVRANMEKKSRSKPKYLQQDYEALLTENAELKRKLKRAE